ncbi:MAG TPA: amidohydrolase [Chitinophagales bacterium]|nr:amidohydrolase [Chitinophagales bacterium]
MKFLASSTVCFLLLIPVFTIGQSKKLPSNKAAVIASVDAHQAELTAISDKIWGYAEIAYQETQSSKALSDYAEAQGFKVQRGVAGIPTAFTATYGSGKPIIGIMGEFDALPGLSQKAQPTKEALKDGAPGHGCGHNMFGPGSLGAAIAIKELMAAGKLKGTIRFYGTPAEEDGAGKVYMAQAGLFNDLDVCLDWHPDYENKANMQSSQAITDWTVEFSGKSSHAAADPWNGRSALDAAELFTTGVNFYREHVKPSARMHYVYKEAGNVPNVIPDKASVWIWMRDSKRTGVAVLEDRVREIAKGAALRAGVEYSIKLNSGLYELLNNETGAKALQANMELLGPITYTDEENAFAKKIQEQYGLPPKGMKGDIKPLEQKRPDPDGGSTDVGDISWIVPEITLLAVTAPYESPWHSWVVVACGGMSIGHKGLLFASKSLGLTMVDLFENETLRNEIKAEFIKRKGDEVWKPLLPEGPPPVGN